MSQVWHKSGIFVAGLKIGIFNKKSNPKLDSNYLIISSNLIVNYELN